MNVQIANIHQAEKIYTLIEENEILHAVASRTTEFDNLDSDDLDIEAVLDQLIYELDTWCHYNLGEEEYHQVDL